MGKTLKRFIRDDSGAIMVLVAIGLVVLIGSMALVIDAGTVYAERMKASNAVDAAVLAGVRELPGNPDAARAVAQQYAQANGLESGQVSFKIEDGGKAIKGTVDKEQNMFFARVFGIDSAEVKPSAKAKVGIAGSLSADSGVVPIGVKEGTFTVGEETTLKWKGGAGDKGWYGCLDLDTNAQTGDHSGGGANTYKEYLMNGYDKKLSTKDVKFVETGAMVGPTDTAIQDRVTRCHDDCGTTPCCTADSFKPDCPRIIITPVGEVSDDPGGNRTFKITGFAAFFVESYEEKKEYNLETGKNEKSIHLTGTFIERVESSADIDDDAEDYGVYAAQLVE